MTKLFNENLDNSWYISYGANAYFQENEVGEGYDPQLD